MKLTLLAFSVAIVAMLIYTGSAECATWRPVAVASGSHSLAGKEATEFKLKSLDGKEVKLSEFKDKVVMLNFIATYSATSKKEVVAIEKLYQKYKEKDPKKENKFVVLGIMSTPEKSKEKVQEFVNKYKITFPMLIGAGKTFKDYKVNQLPTVFYINKDGMIYSVHSGPVTCDEERMSADIKKVMENAPIPPATGQTVIVCD